jgi:hypothetical protein
MATQSKPLRQQLVRLLSWTDAHVGFDAAVTGIPAALRGAVPKGLPYSAWQLLEHMRLAQADILEFCARAHYREKTWPADYWPAESAPPSSRAWGASVAAFKRDRKAFETMIMAPRRDLLAKVPAGTGQTFLREFVLVADHNAYHVGQLVALRRLLGCWAGA